MFYDLSTEWQSVRIPRDADKRKQHLSQLMADASKPVVLIVDNAQDLPEKTLCGLGQLFAIAYSAGGILTVVLAGRSELSQKLAVAESQFPVSFFTLDGGVN